MLTPLEEHIDQLSNVETLQQHLSQSIQLLEEEQMGMLTQFSTLKNLLNDAANKSNNFSVFHERIESLMD